MPVWLHGEACLFSVATVPLSPPASGLWPDNAVSCDADNGYAGANALSFLNGAVFNNQDWKTRGDGLPLFVTSIDDNNWVSMVSAASKGFLKDEFEKHGTCLQVSRDANCANSLMHPLFDVGAVPADRTQIPNNIPRADLERAYYITTVDLFNAFFRGAESLDVALRGIRSPQNNEDLLKSINKKSKSQYAAKILGKMLCVEHGYPRGFLSLHFYLSISMNGRAEFSQLCFCQNLAAVGRHQFGRRPQSYE